MTLLQRMQQNIKSNGAARAAVFYVKSDQRKRIRFLTDFEGGMEIKWHVKFSKGSPAEGWDTPCRERYDEPCEYCHITKDMDKEARTQLRYAWPIWDYETGTVKIFLFHGGQIASPVPQLMDYFVAKKSILGRDFDINKEGSGLDTRYGLVADDPSEFEFAAKAQVLTHDQMLKLLGEGAKPPLGSATSGNGLSESSKRAAPAPAAVAAGGDDDDEYFET